jgi:hypothetical protein
MNKLGRQSYKMHLVIDHQVHGKHTAMVKQYRAILEQTKRHHWCDWLEKSDEPDIWMAHCFTTAAGGDGGKTRIPVLRHKEGDTDVAADSNADKGQVLAKSFFPVKPPSDDLLSDFTYPPPCKRAGKIMLEQIKAQLKRLKPYKAPGPNGIPNIVLTKCADLITERLCHIYWAMVDKGILFKPWKEFITVVLRKLGKPRYDTPKVYRLIVLLNMMWKVITAIMANHITYVTEKHQLLPANHFGGHPSRTTMDAIHLLVTKIKVAWCSKKVTSVLFLDIEGAFPNANPDRLVHNLKKWVILTKYTNFVRSML